jgi:hypothetical protein
MHLNVYNIRHWSYPLVIDAKAETKRNEVTFGFPQVKEEEGALGFRHTLVYTWAYTLGSYSIPLGQKLIVLHFICFILSFFWFQNVGSLICAYCEVQWQAEIYWITRARMNPEYTTCHLCDLEGFHTCLFSHL